MAKRKKTKKSTDDIHSENEFLKMKMMAEFGGSFVGTAENIPPEIENIFLKQVINFHKHHAQAQPTTIYRFIGEPEYSAPNDLGDKEIKKELRRIMSLMKKNGIILNVLAPNTDREIYRFIVEELFKHEIEAVKIKGWTTQFTYEDFHPNMEYDVRSTIHDALFCLFDKGTPFFEQYFSEDMKDHIGLSTDVETLKEKIEGLKDSYSILMPVKYHLEDITLDEVEAKADATAVVVLKSKREGDKRAKHQKIRVDFYLEKLPDTESWWKINRVVTNLF